MCFSFKVSLNDFLKICNNIRNFILKVGIDTEDIIYCLHNLQIKKRKLQTVSHNISSMI